MNTLTQDQQEILNVASCRLMVRLEVVRSKTVDARRKAAALIAIKALLALRDTVQRADSLLDLRGSRWMVSASFKSEANPQ